MPSCIVLASPLASFPGRSLETKLPPPIQHLLLFYEGNFPLCLCDISYTTTEECLFCLYIAT